MNRASLFERLAGESTGRDILPVEEALTASIANHISKLLGTRQGAVQILPDYGLPDLNNLHLSLHDVINEARQHIETVISRYEPRLKSVQVDYLGESADPLMLPFAIGGEIEVNGEIRKISFNASFARGGKVQVL